jgi:BirA family biotin operon repressor/biotin-[acetyl-CoA-carboxylase] ligase
MFTPGCDVAVFHQLSFVAGIAGVDALRPWLNQTSAATTNLQLKWPNDLLIDDAKVGGILVESSKYGDDFVVMIGMGINIAVTPEIAGRAVTQLDRHGRPPTPQQLLLGLADSMSQWLATWANGAGFQDIRNAWLERAHRIGQPLSVNTNRARLQGTFQGLATHGALLLGLENGETARIEHGDVSLASPSISLKERA